MSVAHGCCNAMTQMPADPVGAGHPTGIGNRPRVEVGGHRCLSARPTRTDQVFHATAVWRAYNLEGYLERKLHRQWRNRGS